MRAGDRCGAPARLLGAVVGLVLCVVGGPAAAGDGLAPPADLVLRGGPVLTMDPAHPEARAVAIRGGRIAAVGEPEHLARWIGPATRVVELDGRAVVPGLIDAHGHLMSLGLAMERLDLGGVRSYEALVARVAAAARERPAGTWILGRGFDQSLWPTQELPHHAALSLATPDHPVALTRVDGHALLANARALAVAGVDRSTAAPDGGEILRDARGEPTGILTDNAMGLVRAHVPGPTRADRLRALERAARACAAVGLTAVHDAGVDPETVDLLLELARAGRLPLRVYVMLSGDDAAALARALARGPRIGEAGGLVSVRAVKLMIDGALGSRGARLLEPYADRHGHRGAFVTSPDMLLEQALAARDAGFQVCTHAIGDEGIRVTLAAYERALVGLPAGEAPARRWRVEHAQVIHPDDIPRFAALGVIASMQPTHATSDCRFAERRLGPERLAGAYAWRTLLDSGARLAFGSDFPVEPFDPRLGLYAAVTRTDLEGAPPGGWRTHEALSVEEALHAFTAGAAWAAFWEDEVGRIAPGLWADLVVFDADPRAVAPDALPRLGIAARYLAGEER